MFFFIQLQTKYLYVHNESQCSDKPDLNQACFEGFVQSSCLHKQTFITQRELNEILNEII